MKVTQIKEVVASSVNQATGKTEETALNVDQIIDCGLETTDFNSGESVENFCKCLLDRLMQIMVFGAEYTSNLPSMYVNAEEWGGFIERAYVEKYSYEDDNAYNLTDGESYTGMFTFYAPAVKASVYTKRKAISVPYSIAVQAFKSAFKSWDEMVKLVSSLEAVAEATLRMAFDSAQRMLYAGAIASSVYTTKTARHFVTEYNAMQGEGATPVPSGEKALENRDFAKWLVKELKQTKEYMHEYSSAFNNHDFEVQGRDVRTVLLGAFVNDIETMLYADTYNEGRVSLGEHDNISFWQAIKDSNGKFFTFEQASKIAITDTDNELGTGESGTIEIPYVIGLSYDVMSMGITFLDRRSFAQFNGDGEFTTTKQKASMNWLLDQNLPIVAYILD